jgi:hypothetical protein
MDGSLQRLAKWLRGNGNRNRVIGQKSAPCFAFWFRRTRIISSSGNLTPIFSRWVSGQKQRQLSKLAWDLTRKGPELACPDVFTGSCPRRVLFPEGVRPLPGAELIYFAAQSNDHL